MSVKNHTEDMPEQNGIVNQGLDVAHTQLEARSARKGVDLIFRNINVSIKEQPILDKVSGLAKPGDLLAVMGPSGAGKSTLLNALSGRMPIQSGSITLNGEPMNRKLKRKVCYVLQHDAFFANLSLKETLKYTAALRLPDKMPNRIKQQIIQDIVKALDLEKCLNTPMGGMFSPGLSGGEKKRAGIACELLTNPELIMLDEPTSGLDSVIAYQLMSKMRKYTEDSNKTVIATIHQPSSQIFHMFDNVLLLVNGKVAYFGSGKKILDFFSRLELTCALNYNPADFILEVVKESDDVLAQILEAADARRLTDEWPPELKSDKCLPLENGDLKEVIDKKIKAESAEGKEICEQNQYQTISNYDNPINHVMDVKTKGITGIGYIKKDLHSMESQHSNDHVSGQKFTESENLEQYYKEGAKWNTSFWTQFKTLTKRNFMQARPRIISKIKIFQVFALALFSGLIWFQIPREEPNLNDRIGLMFFALINFTFTPVFETIVAFPEERGVINKERSAGTYRLSAYYLSKMISESPVNFALPLAYIIIVYWMCGLTVDGGSFMAYMCLFFLNSLVAESIGLFIGVSCVDIYTSMTVATVSILSSMLTAGFYVTELPSWFSWISYISFLQYAHQGFMKIEFLGGPPITCLSPEESIFEACQANLTTSVSGAHYLEILGYTRPIWIDVVVLLGYMFFFRMGGYLVLRYLRHPGKK